MGSVRVYILLHLCLVLIRRIRRQEEFKIPLCNSGGGNLLRQSCQTSGTKQRPKNVNCFRKKAPPQLRPELLRKWGVGGMQVHGIRGLRLV